jgi:hypothetical protein
MWNFPSITLLLAIGMVLFIGQVVLKPTLFVDLIPGPGGITFDPAMPSDAGKKSWSTRPRNVSSTVSDE